MKKVFLLSLALAFLTLPLHAQTVWNSKIDLLGNYVRNTSSGSNANGIVSIFTPASAITVNRIQLVAAGGQVCTTLPRIQVTDGTTAASLAIPNTTATNGNPGPVLNDTGAISLSYTAGNQIMVKALPGSSGCNPYEINIVVQYSVTP
jgi:hypothetical protein